ncbi:hypothetical protein ACWIGM_05150 [Bosea sp. NPDC055332]
MPLRSVAADPETLAQLQEAFDTAWAAVANHCEPTATSAARERLGFILVDLWRTEPGSDLVGGAIKRFLVDAVGIASPAPIANDFDDKAS